MVKCVDCGFLAIQYERDGSIREAPSSYRERGYPGESDRFSLDPICFMRVVTFKGQSSANPREERECAEFTAWQQGFAPKEHREMLDRQRMLDWQAEREDKDREWRAEQARIDREWRDDQEERAETRANERHWQEIVIVGLLVGAAVIASQIIAAFIERGSLF